MKYIQKTFLLLACFSFLLSISTIKETYAKYKNDITGTSSIDIARWKILVNNQDVTSSASATATITPTFTGTSNIASGVIAPTSSGYFDIIIDSSDTDVSFSYTITLEDDDNSSVSDLIIEGYKMNDAIENENSTMQTITSSGITGNVLLTSTTTTNTIRVYITWDDTTADAEMNNAADTAASISEDPAIVNVSINFTQLV